MEKNSWYLSSFYGTTVRDPRSIVTLSTPEEEPYSFLDDLYGDYEAHIRKRVAEMFGLKVGPTDDVLRLENLHRAIERVKALNSVEGTQSLQDLTSK